MKQLLLLGGCLFFLHHSTFAQEAFPETRPDFPLVVSIQFNAFSFPFRNLKSHFSNVGFGIGTEFYYDKKDRWAQKVMAIWYRNQTVGNAIQFQSQIAYRPTAQSDLFTEIGIGGAYFHAFRPSTALKQSEGQWKTLGKRGKGMFALPVNIALGYDPIKEGNYTSYFISYQFQLISGYSPSIPLVPGSLLQIGTKNYFK